tara:strand:- start:1423 stop:1959 length:537 start_codon:yes stop_codon:yes gene_type:complete
MYLLKISKKGGDLEDEDNGVLAINEFSKVLKDKKLGQQAMKFVAFSQDYDSPYRYLNERDRARQIAMDLWGKPDDTTIKHPLVVAAIDKYRKLQRDPLDDQLDAFNRKIDQYTTLINDWHLDQDTAEDLQKVMIGIEKLLATRTVLIEAIERRGERKRISGEQKLSFLEDRSVRLNQE